MRHFFFASTALMTVNAFTADDGSKRKFNPGHYISLNYWDQEKEMRDAVRRPGVVGLQKRYQWTSLEASLNTYDFSEIRADLELVASEGKQLVVFIEDKTFKDEDPLPLYMAGQYSLKNKKGGYTAKRWDPYVVNRFSALIGALGNELDSHPALEGIAIQETAHGIPAEVALQNGYTAEKYRDALIKVLSDAAHSMPTSQVFWYMNFLQGGMSYMEDIARIVAAHGVSVGGPDVLPDDYSLTRHTYPILENLKEEVQLFNSVQFNSYNHAHEDLSYGTKYWTMDELFSFARDELYVKYLFWNRKTKAAPVDSYDWLDAAEVIENNPIFNSDLSSSDAFDADVDNDGLTASQEIEIGTNPNKKDTDGDTLSDGDEYLVHGTNPLARNTDNDGIHDGNEIKMNVSDPFMADTDNDGILDGHEIFFIKTDPRKADTDSDGLNDYIEVQVKGTDALRQDSDGDGLSDGEEAGANGTGTNPLNPDSDNGGATDGEELAKGTNPMDPSDDNIRFVDTDEDGLSDDQEAIYGTDPKNWDTDGEGLSDGDEIMVYLTNPLNKNTDRDGINDRIEVLYKKTNPLNPDTDGDGLSDGKEASKNGLGTDPLKSDTDGGGVSDGVEVSRGSNPLSARDD